MHNYEGLLWFDHQSLNAKQLTTTRSRLKPSISKGSRDLHNDAVHRHTATEPRANPTIMMGSPSRNGKDPHLLPQRQRIYDRVDVIPATGRQWFQPHWRRHREQVTQVLLNGTNDNAKPSRTANASRCYVGMTMGFRIFRKGKVASSHTWHSKWRIISQNGCQWCICSEEFYILPFLCLAFVVNLIYALSFVPASHGCSFLTRKSDLVR